MNKALFFFSLFFILFITACSDTAQVTIDRPVQDNAGRTFIAKDHVVCEQDGKPIIREFATSWCPHCAWIKPTYQQVIKEYGDKIIAYQWEADTGDNLLSEQLELAVPQEEMNVWKTFNPDQTIPTFVFGCKYIRIGNAFEEQKDREAEAREFRAVIDKLLVEVDKQ